MRRKAKRLIGPTVVAGKQRSWHAEQKPHRPAFRTDDSDSPRVRAHRGKTPIIFPAADSRSKHRIGSPSCRSQTLLQAGAGYRTAAQNGRKPSLVLCSILAIGLTRHSRAEPALAKAMGGNRVDCRRFPPCAGMTGKSFPNLVPSCNAALKTLALKNWRATMESLHHADRPCSNGNRPSLTHPTLRTPFKRSTSMHTLFNQCGTPESTYRLHGCLAF